MAARAAPHVHGPVCVLYYYYCVCIIIVIVYVLFIVHTLLCMCEDVLCVSLCLFAGAGNTFAVRARRDADYRLCVFPRL